MNCSLCGKQETAFNLNTGKHQVIKHPENIKAIVCSNCMQVILSSSQEELKDAYRKAFNAGEPGKAKVLETFIGQEEQIVGETTESNRDMGRKGAMRKARASYHQLRPERTTRQLDKRRVAVR